MGEAKTAYRELCETEPTIPIFSSAWWLDLVAGPEGWDVVIVEKNGQILASLPFTPRSRWKWIVSTQPKLTQTLGPWTRPFEGKSHRRLARHKDLMESLIEQLPEFDHFAQNWHYSQTNWLPFYWRGFEQTTRYTYAIEDLSDMEALRANFQENIKTDIKKASERHKLRTRDDLGLDAFMELNRMVFQRQEKSLPYSADFVRKIDAECERRGVRKILIAEDAEGRHHAGVYLVWDSMSAYYLMGGGDPNLRGSGATSLCMWEAIKFASTVTKRFDFEGSMLEPVERFFRAFGANQVPYFHVWRTPSMFWKTRVFIRELKLRTGRI